MGPLAEMMQEQQQVQDPDPVQPYEANRQDHILAVAPVRDGEYLAFNISGQHLRQL